MKKPTKKTALKAKPIGKLILARHHESTWNKKGKWTGKTNVPLTPYGVEKANDMGLLIKDLPIDIAFASTLVRTVQTLTCMLDICELHEVPTTHAKELDERDYGDYTGKNKWEMKELVGDDEFKKIRREWDHPLPNGESLKDVYDRAFPYFKKKILPLLLKGKNVLVVSHGNTIRALIKYVESVPAKEMVNVEMPFGAILIYDLDKEGRMVKKEVRQTESEVHA